MYSAFGYQGQKCSACSRAIVDEAVYDEFLDKLKSKDGGLTIGPPDRLRELHGAGDQCAGQRDTILNYIETGKQEGRLITGGEPAAGDGYFIKPTIIADVEPKARIFQEEIFGPVLAVTKAKDFEQALEFANDSEYGLTGAVFTTNPAKAEKAKRQFFVGNLVHQPQVHGRDGRRTSVRRLQHVRHGFEGGRSRLPAAVRAGEINSREG